MNNTPIIRRFWNWTDDDTTGERTLYLNGVIAEESWFADEVTPEAFKNELFSGTGPITLHINSPGGDCIAASQIYTMLMDYPYDVHVQIDGIAASAASVVAMAGSKVSMSPTSLMMVHNPWTTACGDTSDMKKAIALLKEVKESIINAYEIKTGLSRQQISSIMDNETWMNAFKAKELGFCDEVLYSDEEAEGASFGFSSKAAELRLMNMLMDSLPEEQEAAKDMSEEENAEGEVPETSESSHDEEADDPELLSVITQAEVLQNDPMDQAEHLTTEVFVPPDQTNDSTAFHLIQDGIPLPESNLAAVFYTPSAPERVKVTQTDTRLEHLRY